MFSRAFEKYIFQSSNMQRAQNLALSSFVEISSLVLILPLQPLASDLLLIVGLGKELKIEPGKQGEPAGPQHSGKLGWGGSLTTQITQGHRSQGKRSTQCHKTGK